MGGFAPKTVSTEVSKSFGNADGFAESVQQSTGWLQQDRGRWRQLAKFGKSQVSTWSMFWYRGDVPAASWVQDALCWWPCLTSNGGGVSEWLRWAPNGGCGFEWIQGVQIREREIMREFDVRLVPLSLLRIRLLVRCWMEPCDSKNGRGSWKKCIVLSDVQC